MNTNGKENNATVEQGSHFEAHEAQYLKSLRTIEDALKFQVLLNADQLEGAINILARDSRQLPDRNDRKFVSIRLSSLYSILDSVEHLIKSPIRRQLGILRVAYGSLGEIFETQHTNSEEIINADSDPSVVSED